MKRGLIPLAIFAVLVVFLAIGLNRDPREVPSPLVGKPAPAFQAPQLGSESGALFAPKDMLGQVWLLNAWASWCVACRSEHPILMEFSKRKMAPLIGLDYKDKAADGMKWLQSFGNPYQLSAMDVDGRIGIDYGVYGVPETYVIDKAGVIRHKVIGPVTQELLENKIIPLILELQK